MTVRVSLPKTPFSSARVMAGFDEASGGAGGIVTFTGRVRPSAGLEALELQHHPTFTEKAIRQMAIAVQARWSLTALHIVHRTGRMAPGEEIVFVASAAPHRREAFEAADCAMDWLKSKAPFWKREHFDDGTARWVEPTMRDTRDLDRWV